MTQTAQAVFVQGDGESVSYTPVTDLAAGDVVDLGMSVGITVRPIPANELGNLMVGGTWDFLKFAGESIVQWAPVYWDAGTKTATGTVGYSEAVMGICVRAAASGDATVRVKLILAVP